MFKAVDRRICLILCLVIGSISIMTLPFITNVTLFMISTFIQGFISSALSVGANAVILDLWGSKCNTYMQGLHFSFALGMAISPFYLAPYLGLEPTSSNDILVDESTTNSTTSLLTNSTKSTIITPGKSVEQFQLMFILAGIFIMSSGLLQFILYFIERVNIRQILEKKGKDDNCISKEKIKSCTSKNKSSVVETSTLEINKNTSNPDKTFFLTLGSLIFFIYVGMEINSFNFVTGYIFYLNFSIETAAYQATLMNGSFALFRFIGIFLSRFMTTDTMVISSLSLIASSCIISLICPKDTIFWISIGNILFGSGCSAIFPGVCSMIEERIKLGNFSVGLFMFSGSCALVLYPLIVPRILEEYPILFIYNNTISILLVFICVFILMKKHPKKITLVH